MKKKKESTTENICWNESIFFLKENEKRRKLLDVDSVDVESVDLESVEIMTSILLWLCS
jgi:hypothetical protein